jgi:hypothetical protein
MLHIVLKVSSLSIVIRHTTFNEMIRTNVLGTVEMFLELWSATLFRSIRAVKTRLLGTTFRHYQRRKEGRKES